MTEKEWLDCSRPRPLLNAVRGRCSDRKLRLFACACCDAYLRTAHPGVGEMIRRMEEYADGRLGPDELPRRERHYPGAAVSAIRSGHAFSAACNVVKLLDSYLRQSGLTTQAELLREVVGNPFRPAVIDPTWRTPTALGLADAIYSERAFDRLPVLADALEEAGCDNPDILAHCRGPGTHVRGCWAMDFVLGKE